MGDCEAFALLSQFAVTEGVPKSKSNSISDYAVRAYGIFGVLEKSAFSTQLPRIMLNKRFEELLTHAYNEGRVEKL